MPSKDLTGLFAKLKVHSSNNEHFQVEKTCLNLLQSGCTNPKAILKQCIISMIKQDKYLQALHVLKKYNHISVSDICVLEKLYIYYKLNKKREFQKQWQECVPDVSKLLNGNITKFQRALLHVYAQFSYKVGNFNETLKVYQFLCSSNDDLLDNMIELGCNERVSIFSMDNQSLCSITPLDYGSYDMLFNESMILCSKGDYDGSLDMLNKALDLANEDNNQDDVYSIQLQLAYVNQLRGNSKNSKKILKQLLGKLTPRSSLQLIAKHNLKSFQDLSKYHTNMPLLLREIDVEALNSLNYNGFSSLQWLQFYSNILFLKLFSNSRLSSKSGILSGTLSVYSTLIDNVVLEPYKTQSKKLYHYLKKSIKCGVDGNTIGVLLLSVQLQIITKNWDNAIELCEDFWNSTLEFSNNKCLVSYILFQLYQKCHRLNSQLIHLDKIWGFFSSENVIENLEFWKFIGFKFLAFGFFDRSNVIFKKILEVVPDENLLKSALSDDVCTFDVPDELQELVSGVDVPELVSLGSTPFEEKKKSCVSIGKVFKKKRSHKNKKLPKNFDPNKLPDPERWWPLRDRSTYNPKRKESTKHTQGTISGRKTDQHLDLSKPVKKLSKKRNPK